MQMPSDEDIIVFSNGDAGAAENFEEQDFDGRRGTWKRLPLNSPVWCTKAKELGIIMDENDNVVHFVDSQQDNALISPKETLKRVIRAIDEGHIDPDRLLVLSLKTKNENGEGAYSVNFFLSNMRVSEGVALLETAKAEFVSTLRGKG